MGEFRAEKRSGCGLFHIVFGRRSVGPRRSTSLPSSNLGHVTRYPSTPSSKLRNQSFNHRSFDSSEVKGDRKDVDRIIQRPGKNYSKSPILLLHHHHQQPQSPNKHYQKEPGKKTPRNVQNPEIGISDELEDMIMDYRTRKGGQGLMRASSSNVMLFGNLGNLKQAGNKGNADVKLTGNVGKSPVSLCRALSTRMDPEQLKILGNEDYKNGRFAEALALYDAAISVDPNKASYRSNKSAALVGLGKLLEAAFECREAIRIDPFYQRAHNRLAIIYLRLGEAEKALHHFKQSGSDADPEAMNKAKQLQIHLAKCTEAKRQRDWNNVLKETGLCTTLADSAPLIFGSRAEAFLKLDRHQEAIETMENGPNFDIDHCIKFFGPVGCSSLLLFRAQVDLVAGRFDEAIATVQRATRLDPINKEASMVMRRMRGVATARTNGNELFKVGRYSEACIAYGEGLSQDTYNAVLLCNRAACRSKLGQYHKAIEDCNAALKVRPSYSKARLRRADCYAKMGKWGECVQDCEVLLKENPDDEEIGKITKEAMAQIERNGGKKGVNVDSGKMVIISRNQHFRDYIMSHGIYVVLFSRKTENTRMVEIIEPLKQRYPSVNLVKVEVEDHPSLVESERVSSLPTFIIYKNGSRAEEFPVDKYDLLETWIKRYTSSS